MRRIVLVFIAAWIALIGAAAHAADCRRTGEVCVDGPSTKNISGYNVYRACWKYQSTYECVNPNNVDYCAALRNNAGCYQTGSVCSQTAFNGECTLYTNTYRCGDALMPVPTGVVLLNQTYTITQDYLDQSQCQSLQQNPNCTLASKTCTQPGGTRNIDGLDVYKDCWQWEEEYTCASTTLQTDCGSLSGDPKCQLKTSQCIDQLPDGQCGLVENIYSCKVEDEKTETVTTCDQGVCVDGNCTAPTTQNDGDFAQVVSGLEAAREMGTYLDPTTMQMFKGVGGQCSKKLGGLSNCCKGGSGSTSSNNYMIAGIKMIGNEAVRFAGSTYMYDALFTSDLVSSSVLNALYGGSTGASYAFGGDGGIGFYGVTFSIGADGALVVGFDPTSFAIAIAMQIIMDFLSCDQDEQVLAMRKGQGLCHYIGSYCSKKFLGVCIEKKEGYCCFNSKLARIINEQGRAQLGKGWGSAQNPECSGFTQDDLAQLDFSRMNLAEFFGQIVPKQMNTTLLMDRANTTIQNKVNNYFNQ